MIRRLVAQWRCMHHNHRARTTWITWATRPDGRRYRYCIECGRTW